MVEFLLQDDIFRTQMPYLAVLHVDDDYGNSYVSRIRDYLKEYNENQIEMAAETGQSRQFVYMQSIPINPNGSNIEGQIQKLKALGFRTVFAVLKGPTEDFHHNVIMEAQKQNMIGTGSEV